LRQKVGAKHSDRKSTVSPIGYCPNASPLQDSQNLAPVGAKQYPKTLTSSIFHIYSANPK